MKQHLKYIFMLPLFALVIALASWEAPTATYEGENEGVVKSADNQYFAVGDYNVFDYRMDTLTNAETNNLFFTTLREMPEETMREMEKLLTEFDKILDIQMKDSK